MLDLWPSQVVLETIGAEVATACEITAMVGKPWRICSLEHDPTELVDGPGLA